MVNILKNSLEGGAYGLLLSIVAWVLLYFVGGLPCRYPQGPSFCSGVAVPSFIEALGIGLFGGALAGAFITLVNKRSTNEKSTLQEPTPK